MEFSFRKVRLARVDAPTRSGGIEMPGTSQTAVVDHAQGAASPRPAPVHKKRACTAGCSGAQRGLRVLGTEDRSSQPRLARSAYAAVMAGLMLLAGTAAAPPALARGAGIGKSERGNTKPRPGSAGGVVQHPVVAQSAEAAEPPLSTMQRVLLAAADGEIKTIEERLAGDEALSYFGGAERDDLKIMYSLRYLQPGAAIRRGLIALLEDPAYAAADAGARALKLRDFMIKPPLPEAVYGQDSPIHRTFEVLSTTTVDNAPFIGGPKPTITPVTSPGDSGEVIPAPQNATKTVVKFEGGFTVTIYEAKDQIAADGIFVSTAQIIDALAGLSASTFRGIDVVVIEPARNPGDLHWAKEWKMGDFRAAMAAAGVNGHVLVFPSLEPVTRANLIGNFRHEGAHNIWARALAGDAPNLEWLYQLLTMGDVLAVSKYAKNNVLEYWAESSSTYGGATWHARELEELGTLLRSTFPLMKAILDGTPPPTMEQLAPPSVPV